MFFPIALWLTRKPFFYAAASKLLRITSNTGGE